MALPITPRPTKPMRMAVPPCCEFYDPDRIRPSLDSKESTGRWG
jgi:hypothetical protein